MGRQSGQRIQASVHERRFSTSGRAHDEDILFRPHGGADNVRVVQTAHCIEKIILTPNVVEGIIFGCEDAGGFIFLELKDPAWSQADGEHRAAHDRRDYSFKAAPIDGKFGFNDGGIVIQNGAAPSGYRTEGTRRLWRRRFAKSDEAFTHAF
jgi:hypothetical protein